MSVVTTTPVVTAPVVTGSTITTAAPIGTISEGKVIVAGPAPSLQTVALSEKQTSNILFWVGIIILILLIIGIGVAIGYIVTRPVSNPITCVDQTGCNAGYYCSSSGICIAGGGGTSGSPCATDDNCRFGLSCIQGVCALEPTNSIITLCNPIGSLGKFTLSSTIQGKIYFLDITTTGAALVLTAPSTRTYSYTQATQILAVTDTSLSPTMTWPVSVSSASTNNGQPFATNSTGQPICISGANMSAVQLSLPCGSILEYAGITSTSTSGTAFFPAIPGTTTCNNYPPSGSSSTTSRQITFMITTL
ncbi:MAG: hypothetical protein Solivirus4_27 [Solivirus sp.]|uniref:Transmembrane protein n=1 Tax=Solivirus sp. TaxID=2487772 RepID=A0A3G5AFT0_9VIRU|nr:MAG: hypothetical protein Solivirus4_27 [Solivirus sp.]